MKQITNEDELTGKTLAEAPVGSESLILKFTDGTYCAYYQNYVDVLPEFRILEEDEKPTIDDLLKAKIISDEDYQKHLDDIEKEKAESIKNAKLALFKDILQLYPSEVAEILKET